MADIIRLLPDHIANQIAAGEVIQRPASVIKELVENSIDSGATKIEVFVKDAGRTSIQIIDNGKGMSFLDARLCFDRHATSKIQTADDLFNLRTKGFRGEALASVAAIAHVSLKTKRAEDELGTFVQIEGSQIVKQEPVQCAVGCVFEVKNLFYNVPARRNFLKSDKVEFRHIIDEFERVVLAHSTIAFRLVHNDQEIYHLLPGAMRKRIVDVFGTGYNQELVPVNESTDIVRIEGFVGKPSAAKRTRGDQFFFVNDRFFKDSYFNHAVNSAFEQLLPAKYFPSYFLFLDIDPHQIDVNVHPTKTEIKFEADKAIYSILRSAIRLGLGKFNITPTLNFDNESEFDIPLSMANSIPVQPTIQVDESYNPFSVRSQMGSSVRFGDSKSHSNALKSEGFGNEKAGWDDFWNPEEAAPTETQTAISIPETISAPKGPFLLKGSFIIASSQEGLIVIHARRAQERLLYDELLSSFFVQPLASQQLIFPIEKLFSKQERMAWEDHEKTIERIGFSWTWNQDTIQITGIPELLNESTILSCVDKIIEHLQLGVLEKGEVAHSVLSQLAFAGSMSFVVSSDQEALNDFVSRLFNREEYTFSPNGKATVALISNELILHLF